MDELDDVFQSVAEYFAVLAEPSRLKILHNLCDREKSVGEVVAELGMTQANISRHLSLMYRAGIVDRRKEGNLVYYRIIDPNFVNICRTVCVQIASRTNVRGPSKSSLLKLGRSLPTSE